MRAAANGRSMESEIRAILVDAVTESNEGRGMLVTLMDRFGDLGGVDLEVPVRSTLTRAADSVRDWMLGQRQTALFTTSITVVEILAILATRNGKDFEHGGITIVDPWMPA